MPRPLTSSGAARQTYGIDFDPAVAEAAAFKAALAATAAQYYMAAFSAALIFASRSRSGDNSSAFFSCSEAFSNWSIGDIVHTEVIADVRQIRQLGRRLF